MNKDKEKKVKSFIFCKFAIRMDRKGSPLFSSGVIFIKIIDSYNLD